MKNTFAYLFLLQAIISNAQTVVTGTLPDLPPEISRTILLESFFADDYDLVDSAKLSPEGKFAFSPRKYEPGLYRMGFKKEGHPIEFVISNADSVIVFNFKFDEMLSRRVVPVGSRENTAYQLVKSLVINSDKTLMIEYEMMITSLPANPAQAEKHRARIVATLDEIERQVGVIKKDYPETFSAKVLSKFVMMPDRSGKPLATTRGGFYQQHLFNNLDYNDSGILRAKFLRDLIVRFSQAWFQESQDSNAFTDAIMGHAGTNVTVANFLFKNTLERCIKERNETGAQYLLNSYNPGCTDEDPLNPAGLIGAMNKCKPGNTAFDLAYGNAKDQEVKFSDVYSKNKATLLVFWRTNCPHCVEELPKLEAFYNANKAKGLGMYCVSIDNKKDEWLKYLNEHPNNLVHVNCPRGKMKELMNNYPVTGTPMLMIVNQKGVIQNRLISSSDVEALLLKALE